MATKPKKLPKRREPTADGSNDDLAAQGQGNDFTRIEGLKYFAMLQPLLEHLREVQCERDKAGNRKLHDDQYCMLVLLYVLNPTVSSLRSLSPASELTQVQSRLGTDTASLGSLSESSRLRDNTVCEVTEQRELTDGDRSAGVISDQIISLGGSSSNSACTDHKVRLVEIRCTPHLNRTGGKPLMPSVTESNAEFHTTFEHN